jgi:hypothetical protein
MSQLLFYGCLYIHIRLSSVPSLLNFLLLRTSWFSFISVRVFLVSFTIEAMTVGLFLALRVVTQSALLGTVRFRGQQVQNENGTEIQVSRNCKTVERIPSFSQRVAEISFISESARGRCKCKAQMTVCSASSGVTYLSYIQSSRWRSNHSDSQRSSPWP